MSGDNSKFEERWLATFNESARKEKEDYAIATWTKHGFEGNLTYFLLHFDKLIKSKKLKILDYGCGPGAYCEKLADKGHQVYGCDFSKKMISLAKKRDTQHRINYDTAPIYKLPYKKNSLDVIICIGVFQTVDNPDRALREFHRVLKPKGLLILNTLNLNSLSTLHPLFWNHPMMHENRSIALRRYNPFHFATKLGKLRFTDITLKGVYFFSERLSIVEHAILKLHITDLLDYFFFVGKFFSHSFMITGRAVKNDISQ